VHNNKELKHAQNIPSDGIAARMALTLQ